MAPIDPKIYTSGSSVKRPPLRPCIIAVHINYRVPANRRASFLEWQVGLWDIEREDIRTWGCETMCMFVWARTWPCIRAQCLWNDSLNVIPRSDATPTDGSTSALKNASVRVMPQTLGAKRQARGSAPTGAHAKALRHI
eukprot:9482905-Pyramimonas_sp.AAC.1